VNDAPVAMDDEAEVNENDSVEIDVLANDSDVDGDVLKVISATGATMGSVTVNGGGGSVTYTPEPRHHRDRLVHLHRVRRERRQ
jgi:large repetitive protein